MQQQQLKPGRDIRQSKDMGKPKGEIQYPPNCNEIPTGLSNNELVRRLKILCKELQELPQDAEGSKRYTGLANHLAGDYFLTHSSREVRILVACAIADILRIFAPDAPYGDPHVVKEVLLYLIRQMRGLDQPTDSLYVKYYYLLENMVSVKSLALGMEVDEFPEILAQLLKTVLMVVREEHGGRIHTLLMDLISPLLQESDQISNRALDALFLPLIEPHKTQNRESYKLAKEIIYRCEPSLELAIQHYFNQMLLIGEVAGSELNGREYDILFELYHISRDLTFQIFPQLDFKFKVTMMIGRLMVEVPTTIGEDHPNLVQGFMRRFRDVSPAIRIKCVRASSHIMIRHHDIRPQFSEGLQTSILDTEEEIRHETVLAINRLAKDCPEALDDQLLECLRLRTLDKQFRVRKEAMMSLAIMYRKAVVMEEGTLAQRRRLAFIKNTILSHYSQKLLEDMLLCEKLLHTCLVPYLVGTEKRMETLFTLYCTLDEIPIKCFNNIVLNQLKVRDYVRWILELHREEESEARDRKIMNRLRDLSERFTDPENTRLRLKEFYDFLAVDPRGLKLMEFIVGKEYTTKEMEAAVKELILKAGQVRGEDGSDVGSAMQPAAKALLERCAPLIMDKDATAHLVQLVARTLDGHMDFPGVSQERTTTRALRLILLLTNSFPQTFDREETVKTMGEFMKRGHSHAGKVGMMVIGRIGADIPAHYPRLFKGILSKLVEFAKSGTGAEAKEAVKCIHAITGDRRISLFRDIIQEGKEHMRMEDPMCPTALKALATIALLEPGDFTAEFKRMVSSDIVEKIILTSQSHSKDHDMEEWVPRGDLSTEATAKIGAMKFLTRWLCGLKTNEMNYATKTMKMLTAILETKGDIREEGLPPAETAHLRLVAGCCLLKLAASEKLFHQLLTVQQLQTMAYLLCDECKEVRVGFALKLHKKLESMKLPLEYMSVFALTPLLRPSLPDHRQSVQDFHKQMKSCVEENIARRRSVFRRVDSQPTAAHNFVPENVLWYVVHLLANHPRLKSYDDVPVLQDLRECLWFVLGPLLEKKGSEGGNCHFVYRLFQDIKQCWDALGPEDEARNKKLWAMADMGMLLVAYRVPSFILRDVSFDHSVPKRYLIAGLKDKETNTEIYLPTDLIDHEKRTHGSKNRSRARLNLSSKPANRTKVQGGKTTTSVKSAKKTPGAKKNGKADAKKERTPLRKQPARKSRRLARVDEDSDDEGEEETETEDQDTESDPEKREESPPREGEKPGLSSERSVALQRFGSDPGPLMTSSPKKSPKKRSPDSQEVPESSNPKDTTRVSGGKRRGVSPTPGGSGKKRGRVSSPEKKVCGDAEGRRSPRKPRVQGRKRGTDEEEEPRKAQEEKAVSPPKRGRGPGPKGAYPSPLSPISDKRVRRAGGPLSTSTPVGRKSSVPIGSIKDSRTKSSSAALPTASPKKEKAKAVDTLPKNPRKPTSPKK